MPGQHLHSVVVKISDLIFDSKSTIAVIFYANVYSKYYKKYSCKEIEESMKNVEELDIDKTLLMFEMERMRLKWLVEKKTAIAAFEACNEDFFPNI